MSQGRPGGPGRSQAPARAARRISAFAARIASWIVSFFVPRIIVAPMLQNRILVGPADRDGDVLVPATRQADIRAGRVDVGPTTAASIGAKSSLCSLTPEKIPGQMS